MSFYTPFGVVTESKSNTLRYISGGVLLQHTKAPTDKIFLTNLKLVSLLTDFAYVVEDKDSIDVGNGDFTSNPVYINGISAFTTTDSISVSYLKYGYKFNKAVFVLTPVETLLFMAHSTNSNITLNLIDANALIGITVDKANKTVTISASRTQGEVYDFLQAYQANVANVDTLVDSEIFSTILGNTFNIASGWSFIFSAAPSGTWSITGLVAFVSVFAVNDFNTSGNIHFTLAGTWGIADSSINSVSSDVANVVIDPTGNTLIATNNNPTNITINATQPTLTITVSEPNCEIRLYEADSTGVNMGTEIAGTESFAGTEYTYQHDGSVNDIYVQVILLDYEEVTQPFQLSSANQFIDIDLRLETND